jgi:hypothetical protein
MHLRQQIIIDIRSTLHKHKLRTGFALGRQLCSRHGTASYSAVPNFYCRNKTLGVRPPDTHSGHKGRLKDI